MVFNEEMQQLYTYMYGLISPGCIYCAHTLGMEGPYLSHIPTTVVPVHILAGRHCVWNSGEESLETLKHQSVWSALPLYHLHWLLAWSTADMWVGGRYPDRSLPYHHRKSHRHLTQPPALRSTEQGERFATVRPKAATMRKTMWSNSWGLYFGFIVHGNSHINLVTDWNRTSI